MASALSARRPTKRIRPVFFAHFLGSLVIDGQVYLMKGSFSDAGKGHESVAVPNLYMLEICTCLRIEKFLSNYL